MFVHTTQRSSLGIITSRKSEYVQIWMIGHARIVVPINSVVFDPPDIDIAEWVSVVQHSPNTFHIVRLSDDCTSELPIIHATDRYISVEINFMPLDWFLYPTNSKEKNLRMAATLELGNIPIVFKNEFKPYCCYRGMAQIIFFSFQATAVEKKLELMYHTPWLILRKESYPFSLYMNIKKRLPVFVGIVIKEFPEMFFVYNCETGVTIMYKVYLLEENVEVGDIVEFCFFQFDEQEQARRLALAPKRTSLSHLELIVKDNSVVELIHDIKVGVNPTHMGSYYIDIVGSVCDSNGIVTVKVENKVLKVRSRCRLDLVTKEVFFEICSLEDFQEDNNHNNKEIVEEKNFLCNEPELQKETTSVVNNALPSPNMSSVVNNALPSPNMSPVVNNASPSSNISCEQEPHSLSQICEGIVFHKNYDSVLVYSKDPSFTNGIGSFSFRDFNDKSIPKLGEWVSITNYQSGFGRQRQYVLNSIRVMDNPKCEYKIVNDRLNVRVSISIIDNVMYNNFFGTILDLHGRLSAKLLTDTNLRFNAWCIKINRTSDGCHWTISDVPDIIWEDQQSEMLEVVIPKKKFSYSYVGAKYRNRSSQTANVKSEESTSKNVDEKNHCEKNHKRVSPSGISTTKVRHDRSKTNSPSDNLDSFQKKFFKNKPKLPPAVIANHQSSLKPISTFPNIVDHDDKEQVNAPEETFEQMIAGFSKCNIDCNNFLPKFQYDGVVVSKFSLPRGRPGLFIYSKNSPDQEYYLPPENQYLTIKHGDWVNFRALYIKRKYIITEYILRPPMVPSRILRNTIELILDAFVPQNYSAEADDSCIVHSDFVKTICDLKRLIRPEMIRKTIKIIAIRSKPRSTSIPWQIETILESVQL